MGIASTFASRLSGVISQGGTGSQIWPTGPSVVPGSARGVAVGKSAATSPEAPRAHLRWRSGLRGLQENLRGEPAGRPYQKPTQAGKERILRRSRELS